MKLIALEPLKAGGARHMPGAAFECPDAVGQQLIASGAAETPANVRAVIREEAAAEAASKDEPQAKPHRSHKP